MDDTYKCFRCGKEMFLKTGYMLLSLTARARVFPVLDGDIWNSETKLCPTCMQAFDAWLALPGKSRQQWPPVDRVPSEWEKIIEKVG